MMRGRFSITCGPPLKRASQGTQQKKKAAAPTKTKKKTPPVETPQQTPQVQVQIPESQIAKSTEKNKKVIQDKPPKKMVTPKKVAPPPKANSKQNHQQPPQPQPQPQQIQQQQQNTAQSQIHQVPPPTPQQQIPASPMAPSLAGFSQCQINSPDRDALIDSYEQLVVEYRAALEKRTALLAEKKKIRCKIAVAYKTQTEIENQIRENARQKYSFQVQ
ncbi:hypothetical protein TRFO_04629 [Tritrichomonas foetus]|uniref:Uncharacterized protein n=1 Tax=Tritrichomonas foetus TaxID=1144522 RepID=A0A1J4KGW6_9EUKA|nr:hypothetical protein TRFO_04629 [Tritrichomonas foetus]|eukprot:OHT09060.1 hypothetical protein TRFO_04629 [Tritrichomonas foetus]